MAKPHKFAWNGIDVETALNLEQLTNMALRAAQECSGDLTHGKHRIEASRSDGRRMEFRVNDFLVTFKKYLVFYLEFEERRGRTWMSSRIDWYVTTQPTVGGFIPFGSKVMLGHHTYLQFVHHLADQVRHADPQARITVREGVAATSLTAASDPAPSLPASAPSSTPPPTPVTMPPPAWACPADPAHLPTQSTSPGLVGPAPPAQSAGGPGRPISQDPPQPHPTQSLGVPAPTPGFPGGWTGGQSQGLVTGVPGMPRREAPPPEPAEQFVPGGYASIAEQLFAEDDDLFHTRMVQQGDSALPWLLLLPDGQEVALMSALVLGRNPSAPDGSQASPLPVNDPRRSVSKTHAIVELRNGLPWVVDLHSTNGTTLTNDVGEALVCEPGTPVPIGDGWVLGLGDCAVRVARRGAHS